MFTRGAAGRRSGDLAANDAGPVEQSAFDNPLQPLTGDRPGDRQDEEEADNVAQRLTDDALAHLGVADRALDKGDRHLDHGETPTHRPPYEVDLEAVTLGGDVMQVQAAQCRRAV